MRDTALEGPWRSKLASAAESRTTLDGANGYYELLRPIASRVDIWRTTYYHQLAGGAAAVVEWFKGSGLRPFLQPLSEGERSAYLERYTAAIARVFTARSDGSVLLPFPRLFMVAIRCLKILIPYRRRCAPTSSCGGSELVRRRISPPFLQPRAKRCVWNCHG